MGFSSHVRAGVLAIFSLMAVPAFAAEPVDISPRNQKPLTLGVDELKFYKFDEPITAIEIVRDGLVTAVPRSQTEMSLLGRVPGRSPISVFGEGRKRLYTGIVEVTQEPGHPVRIYRQPTPEEKEAVGRGNAVKTDAADDYWCTDIRCSKRLELQQNR